MEEFWESSFQEKQAMWGLNPSKSAVLTKDFFIENNVKDILIPGIGYGRNAKIFHENGINVTGIEISKTAIELARVKEGLDIKIYHGSVNDMPFDNNIYDGIFCYALLHLLNNRERHKLIRDCYNQLKPNGHMIFTVISKKAPMYKTGKQLSSDRYETMKGVKLFFYDSDSIKREFKKYGLMEFSEIDEPINNMENKPPLKFLIVKCKKVI